MARRVLVGCGYLGSRVASLWARRHDAITVLTRSSQRAASFALHGYDVLVGDVLRPETLTNLFDGSPPPETLVYAVGYDSTQTASIAEVYAGGFAAVLQLVPDSIQRIIYISTTGVYGDARGAWIDESTLPQPSWAGGFASLEAERVLQQSRFATRGLILRLAGIYGPNRLPYLELIRRGKPLEASPEGYLNLIHVDDAARVIATVADTKWPEPGPLVYCVSDGCPVKRADFYSELARQLGAPTPKYAETIGSGLRQQRASANKRVTNRRLMEDFALSLQYPTYREGLAHLVAASAT